MEGYGNIRTTDTSLLQASFRLSRSSEVDWKEVQGNAQLRLMWGPGLLGLLGLPGLVKRNLRHQGRNMTNNEEKCEKSPGLIYEVVELWDKYVV